MYMNFKSSLPVQSNQTVAKQLISSQIGYLILLNIIDRCNLKNCYVSFLIGKKRKRCGVCEHCTAYDCGKCRFCQDKPNFGGRNILKQCCQQRKCKKLRLTSSGKF